MRKFSIHLLYTTTLLLWATQALSSQPGENLWHLAASIATKTDMLGQCLATPVSESTINISQPGKYCLSSGLSGTGIIISSSDVFLDLNGQLISNAPGSMAISTTNNVSRITIQNGFIDGCDEGVSLAVGTSDVTIKDLQITNCNRGVRCNTASNVVIDNIEVSTFIDYGVVLFECSNVSISNCAVTDDLKTGTGHAFHITNFTNLGTGIVVNNCQSNNALYGFYIESDCLCDTAINILNCLSTYSNNYGFELVSTHTNNAILCKNCTASFNHLSGFDIECIGGVFENCVAQGNNNSGFTCATDIAAAEDCIIINCQATNNAEVGFDFSNTGTANIIQNCIATTHQTGFMGNAAMNNLFLFNTTSFNSQHNYVDVEEGNSATVTALNGTGKGLIFGSNSYDRLLL